MYQKGFEPAEILYRTGYTEKFRERDVWQLIHSIEFVGGTEAARVWRYLSPPDYDSEPTDDELQLVLATLVFKPESVPVYYDMKDKKKAEEIVTRCKAIKAGMPRVIKHTANHYKGGCHKKMTDEQILDEMKMYNGDNLYEFAEIIGYSAGRLKIRINNSELDELRAVARRKRIYAFGVKFKGKYTRKTNNMYKMRMAGASYDEIADRYGITHRSAVDAVGKVRRKLGLGR